MISQHTDTFIKICMKTWLLCESCKYNEETQTQPRELIVNRLQSCASSCFALVTKLVSNTEDQSMNDTVFNCMVECRACMAACGKFIHEDDMLQCVETCDMCNSVIKNLYSFQYN